MRIEFSEPPQVAVYQDQDAYMIQHVVDADFGMTQYGNVEVFPLSIGDEDLGRVIVNSLNDFHSRIYKADITISKQEMSRLWDRLDTLIQVIIERETDEQLVLVPMQNVRGGSVGIPESKIRVRLPCESREIVVALKKALARAGR